AYHIVTNIGEGTPKLKILKKEFKTVDQQNLFAVSVANIGDLFLNPKLVLKLYNSQGKLEKTLDGQPERLYPGSSQIYLMDIQGLEAKKYTAFLMLDNGDKQLFGDTFDFIVP
ncbi:MAG: hypothetical protein H0X29_11890, partial [Parachlamydiaceae bacterium]|nr:hypothetical protein [Parachlamydiaceae bacterium]